MEYGRTNGCKYDVWMDGRMSHCTKVEMYNMYLCVHVYVMCNVDGCTYSTYMYPHVNVINDTTWMCKYVSICLCLCQQMHMNTELYVYIPHGCTSTETNAPEQMLLLHGPICGMGVPINGGHWSFEDFHRCTACLRGFFRATWRGYGGVNIQIYPGLPSEIIIYSICWKPSLGGKPCLDKASYHDRYMLMVGSGIVWHIMTIIYHYTPW